MSPNAPVCQPATGFVQRGGWLYSGAMMTIPTIETPRLRLRAPELRDFGAYAAMWADERVTRFIGAAPRPRDESWRRFIGVPGLWALLGYGYWVFAERESDALIGIGGLAFFERGLKALEGLPEAGWAIAPDWWGKGIATEAMAAALDWSDSVLAAAEVRCIINPGHSASEKVAAKLGFALIDRAEMHPDPVNVYARHRRITPR